MPLEVVIALTPVDSVGHCCELSSVVETQIIVKKDIPLYQRSIEQIANGVRDS